MVSEWQGGEAARLQVSVWHGGHKTRELGAVQARRTWSVDPSHRHPHRWRAPHRELSGCGPAICLHKGSRRPAQRGAQVGVYKWLLLSTPQPPSSSPPPEACPWHVFSSFPVIRLFLSSCPSWACGHQGASGSAERAWCLPLAPHDSSSPRGKHPPCLQALAQAAQVAAGDLRSASHWAQAEPAGAGSPPHGLLEPLCGVGGSQAWKQQRDMGQGRSPLRSCCWDREGVVRAECGLEAEP